MTEFKSNQAIHQAVHGYTDGHRLLAASVRLSPETQRVLTMMSDMSGPGMRPGFETYLTAYPLPGGYYALARTWYAAEMPRPGCVWTHTLLLSVTLAGKVNPFTLLRYFRRPLLGDYTSYSTPLQVPYSGGDVRPSRLAECDEFGSAAVSVFRSDEPVVFPADSAEKYEDLVLSIWNVQSAPLRQNFSFCSGALAPRQLNGRTLDLQVMPFERANRLGPKLKSRIVADAAAPDWLGVLSSALAGRSDVVAFLRRFGGEDPRRPYVGQLAGFLQSSRLLEGRPDAALVVEAAAMSFPSCSEAALLKTELLGARRHYLPQPDLQLIRCLVLSAEAEAFDPTALKLRARTRRLVRKAAVACVQIGQAAARMASTPMREEFLEALASASSAEALLGSAGDDVTFAKQMIVRGSRLLESASFWQSRAAGELVSILYDIDTLTPQARLRGILGLIRSDVAGEVSKLVGTLPPEYGVAAVRVLVSRGRTAEAEELIRGSSHVGTYVLAVVESKPKLNATDAYLAAVSCDAGRECSAAIWSKLVESSSRPAANAAAVNAYAFIAAIKAADSRFAQIVAVAFDPLHQSVAAGQLPREVLDALAANLLSIDRAHDWDLCERLRRTLMAFFTEDGWPAQWFFASVKQRETLSRCLSYTRSTKRGRKWLDRVIVDVERHRLRIDRAQYRMLCLAAAS